MTWLPPFGTLAGEAARAALVLAAFAAVIAAAELWHRRAHPPVEWTRKLVHFGAGMIAVAFPWLIASPWTLLAIAVGAGAPVLWARARGKLPSVFGVERESLGEVYFPIAVFLLFAIGRRQPVFYLAALLTLVVCDALAAVLGRAYGKHQYLVTTDRRSLEGSAVFLFTAFMAVHLPLLLWTDIDRAACVLVALQVALLVASFEALGARGSDNLLVPLGTYYLLVKIAGRPVEAVAVQLTVQLTILVAMLAIARTTRFLTFSGALAAHLVLYAAFSLGGPAWIVPPALTLAAAIVLEHQVARAVRTPSGGYHVAVIFYVSIVAVLLIFADNTFATLIPGPHALGRGHPFHAPFVGSLAAAIAIIGYWSMETLPRVRHRPVRWRGLACALLGFGVVAPLGLWVERGGRAGIEFATAALLCALGLLVFLGARRVFHRPPGTLWDLRFLALSVLAATLSILPLHFHWLGAVGWRLR